MSVQDQNATPLSGQQSENFWIFLCFGQSNMAGQAPIEDRDLEELTETHYIR